MKMKAISAVMNATYNSPHMLLSVNLLLHLFSALSRYQDTLKSINLNRFSCMLCKKGSDIFLLRNLISLLPN